MLVDSGGASSERVVVEGALPRDRAGRLLVPFRPGDVLRASGPFVGTTVTSVTRSAVVLRWPWRRVDPASDYGWTGGEFGFTFRDLHKTLYRTEPPLTELRPGQRCRVGVPPTRVHVVEVDVLDQPQDRGMLPRPSGWLTVLPTGASFDPTDREPAIDVELVAESTPRAPTPGVELAEPIRMELEFRPYAFLTDGDVVTDADGRTWRFEVPFWWQELDGTTAGGWLTPRWVGAPRWPLRLASHDGEPDPARAAAVGAATATGAHADEVTRWQRLTRADPVPIRPYIDPDEDLEDDFDDLADGDGRDLDADGQSR